MRSLAALFLLAFYLLVATEVHQLMRLPQLWVHYVHHKTEGNDNTFTAYLVEHYVLEQNNDEDSQDDRQLPFKSNDNCITISLSAYEPPVLSTSIQLAYVRVQKVFSWGSYNLLTGFYKGIWQPPCC